MDNQREAFETWAERKGLDLQREGESYYDTDTHFAFSAWQAAQESQWQSIDTAPKEELRDLIVFNGEVQHGQWWEGYWIDSMSEYMTPQPTHWMPLPDGPET